MHSPQWLRTYMAHLGILLPVLDALWCSCEITPQVIREGLRQHLDATGCMFTRHVNGIALTCKYDMLDCMLSWAQHDSVRIVALDIGKHNWHYCVDAYRVSYGSSSDRTTSPCGWLSDVLAALDAHLRRATFFIL
jgi:hypothetical protein